MPLVFNLLLRLPGLGLWTSIVFSDSFTHLNFMDFLHTLNTAHYPNVSALQHIDSPSNTSKIYLINHQCFYLLHFANKSQTFPNLPELMLEGDHDWPGAFSSFSGSLFNRDVQGWLDVQQLSRRVPSFDFNWDAHTGFHLGICKGHWQSLFIARSQKAQQILLCRRCGHPSELEFTWTFNLYILLRIHRSRIHFIGYLLEFCPYTPTFSKLAFHSPNPLGLPISRRTLAPALSHKPHSRP